MKNVPAKKIHTLDGAVVPQLFTMRDGEIYFFDRINEEEGRFCIKSSSGVKTILEIENGQGIISKSGELYKLEMGEDTIMSVFTSEGGWKRLLTLSGIFFDIKIDTSGNLICLGYQRDEVLIKIFNSNGIELSTIRMPSLAFISSIYLKDDYIYIGGFDRENIFKLVIINYIGNVIKEWNIEVESSDRIIGKIQTYKDYVIMLFSGKSSTMGIFNLSNGKVVEILPAMLKIRDFNDFELENGNLYVLCDRAVYQWDLTDIINLKRSKSLININVDLSLTYYKILMMFKGIRDQIIPSIKISFLLFTLIGICIILSQPVISPLEIIQFLCIIFWPISFSIAILRFALKTSDKSRRVESLLDIYYGRDFLYIDFALYYSAAFFSVLCLVKYPFYNISSSFLLSAFVFIVVIIVNYKLIKVIQSRNQEFMIDLLHEDDGNLGNYLKTALDKLKNNSTEKICIKIVTNGKVKGGVVKRWWETRKEIIGRDVKYNVEEGKIVTYIDLSKRDVKYSRYSIIMDYICYIGDKVEVKEIQILDTKETR